MRRGLALTSETNEYGDQWKCGRLFREVVPKPKAATKSGRTVTFMVYVLCKDADVR